MGNVVAVERGRGMLVIDPSLFAVGQSPSVALVANMSDEERDRVLFLDAGDPECSFGVNPFASIPMGDSEESDTCRNGVVRSIRDMLMPFLDMDTSDEMLKGLMDNILTLMACMPGAALTDIPVFAESVLAREVAEEIPGVMRLVPGISL